jgi:hypothetical protein
MTKQEVYLGACYLKVAGQAVPVVLGHLSLARGNAIGASQVDNGVESLTLNDIEDDVIWAYHRSQNLLLVGSETGSSVYLVDVNRLLILQQIQRAHVDDNDLRRLWYIVTPDELHVLVIADMNLFGLAWNGQLILKRAIDSTDHLLNVSNVWVGLQGIEHEERLYYFFGPYSEAELTSSASDHVATSLARPAMSDPDEPLGLPITAYRRADSLEFGWTKNALELPQSPEQLSVSVLSEISFLFIRTQSGVFPMYPTPNMLVDAMTIWTNSIIWSERDPKLAHSRPLFFGQSSLYQVLMARTEHDWYLRFVRAMGSAYIDLLAPIVISGAGFQASFMDPASRMYGFIETHGTDEPHMRAFQTAFKKLQEVWS